MKDHIKRLAKGSSIYGIGAILPKLVGLLLIPIYTRYLSTSDYGILSYVKNVHSILFIVLEFGLGHAVLRFYFDHRDDPEMLKKYLATIQTFLFGAGFVVVGALVLFGERIFSFLSFGFYPYLLLGVVTTFLSLGSIVILELFRAREQAGRYIAFQIAAFLITAFAIIFFVVGLKEGALGAIKARFYVAAAFCVVYLFFLLREVRPGFDRKLLGQSLRFGLPLMPMMLANWILTFSDQILMERMLTLSDVGVYALGYTIGMLMGDVVRSINKAYVPYFFDTAKSEKDAPKVLAYIALAYLGFISVVALVGILFCREGVMLLATEPYYAAAKVAPFIICGYLLRGMHYMAINPLYYLKRTGVLAWSTGVAAVVNVALNFWWIPAFGIFGAAYSTVVAYLCAFLICFAFAQKWYPIPYNFPKIILILVLFVCCAALGTWPQWEGYVIPILAKLFIAGAFVVSLYLLGVIRWGDDPLSMKKGKKSSQ